MTAPALPGALPPEVESAVEVYGDAVRATCGDSGPENFAALEIASDRLRTAILAAMRAATAGSGAASPAAGASARALGGDGEPVAADERTVNSDGAPFAPILRDMLAVESDRLRASYTAEERDEVLRLATVLTMASDYIAAVVEGKGPRPAATGDTGEGERNAAWWELCASKSEWRRNDGRTHIAVRVHDGADLSCRAMREDAMIRAIERGA